MTSVRLLTVLVLAAVAQACATAPSPRDTPLMQDFSLTPPPRCAGLGVGKNRDACSIAVEVTERGGRCSVSMSNDLHDVVFSNFTTDPDPVIVWVLNGPPGYSFRSDGIFIPDNVDDPQEFDLFKLFPNGRAYQVRNLNRRDRLYKYWIHVIKEGNPADVPIQCFMDPRIHNEGRLSTLR